MKAAATIALAHRFVAYTLFAWIRHRAVVTRSVSALLAVLLASCSSQLTATSPNASNQLHTLSLPMASIVEAVSPNAPATQSVGWMNTLGYPIYLTGFDVWVGADGGNVSDINVLLMDVNSGDVYLSTNWDHYQNPVSIDGNYLPINYPAPYYFLINPGDTVELTLAGVSYLPTSKDIGASALLRYVK